MRNAGAVRSRGAIAVAGLIIGLALIVFATPTVVLAHALLVRSNPAPDVVLRSSPASVHLWFTEDLNGTASRIVVWDRYRHVENAGAAFLIPGQPRQMGVRLKPLTPGAYLVLWTSVSAEDGHILKGSYLFYVKRRGPGPSLAGVSLGGPTQTFPDAIGILSIAAHWLELLAAVTWTGALAISAAVFRPSARELGQELQGEEHRRVRRLAGVALVILIVASTVVFGVNVYNLAGNGALGLVNLTAIRGALSDQYGQLWIVRQALAVIALALGAVTAGRRPGGARGQLAVLVAVGLVYLYAFAASGHAASARIGVIGGHISPIFSGSVVIDWVHFVADALWLGGQMYIVLVLVPVLRPLTSGRAATEGFLQALNRFSPYAYASVAAFTLSGAFNGVIHIPSWYAFFHSAYGWALVVKMLLIGAMMLVSALTVYILRPHIRRELGSLPPGSETPPARMRTLLTWLRVNPVLGGGVLLATSVMFSYPVPVGLSPPGPSGYTTRANGLTATLTLSPDRSGPNTMTVSLVDGSGRPVRYAHISVLTTMLDMEMGTGLASLNQTAPGRFSGSTDLGMGGRWRLTLLVYQTSSFSQMQVDVRVGS